jgi:hypothetical protein
MRGADDSSVGDKKDVDDKKEDGEKENIGNRSLTSFPLRPFSALSKQVQVLRTLHWQPGSDSVVSKLLVRMAWSMGFDRLCMML